LSRSGGLAVPPARAPDLRSQKSHTSNI
jgi:hypothetical protein